MRVPQDMMRSRRGPSKAQLVLVAVVAVVLVVIFSLKGLAIFYTDYLWFANYHLGSIWSGVLLTKVELWLVFGAIFAAGCYTSLALAHRAEPVDLAVQDDLVQRYRNSTAQYPKLIRGAITAAATLIVAAQAPGEWKNWLLFRNYVPFPMSDPQFHKNVGFFVFQLPFIEFLIGWSFFAVSVIFVLSVGAAYLNGAIRLQPRGPKVTPRMKAHISVLLAVMALIKAVGYYFQRFQLDTSTRGVVEGASYTDIHAQLPAINLLIFISIIACGLFVLNIYRQGWVLPTIGLGLWAFISIALGAIYPAILQKFVVAPAQGQKELPYITRNIAATRYAMGINRVSVQSFAAASTNATSVVGSNSNAAALASVRLWGTSVPLQTFDKLQDIRSYYQFNSLAVDSYSINGQKTPVVVGVRQLNSGNLPAQSWVNQHLQFTHGYGAAIAVANQISPDGNPAFNVKDLPPASQGGFPTLTQPQVYYGQNISGYVISNSLQPEIDYQLPSGASVETHYGSTGGVQLSSLLRRAAFALRFGDINILVSSLVTPNSRIMFERDIMSRVQMAMPFLKYGSNPYPVVANGRIFWVINGYTTTSNFPYGQAANTEALSSGSQLANTSFNYIRNSVKVVISAYSGAMHFYVTDPRDPLIRSYEKAFPGIFQPVSSMPASIASHLRYPSDMLAVQSAMYGVYHVTNPSNFYSGGNAWALSQSPQLGPIQSGSGSFSLSNSAGFMSPVYEMMQLPGSSSTGLSLMEAYVPLSPNGQQQNLTGLLVGQASRSNPYQLDALVTPNGQQIDGPALVSSRILSATNVSQEITLLDQHGSTVSLGSLSAVPLGQNLLWVRPMYVSSSSNPLPEIKQVIVAYGTQVALEPTFAGALKDIFGQVPSGVQGSNQAQTTTTSKATLNGGAAALIAKAQVLYTKAQAALKAGNLALYQQDIDQIGSLLNQISTSSAVGKAAHAAG